MHGGEDVMGNTRSYLLMPFIRLPVETDVPSGCGSLISSQFSFIPTASTNPKAALKSKIVAEFRVSL